MATHPIPMEFDDFANHIEQVFDEMKRRGEPVLVEREGVLYQVEPKTAKGSLGRRKGKRFTTDDALFHIVGIGNSEGPTDVASNKHAYLADAYDPKER